MLLLHLCSRQMPCLAILRTSTQIRLCINAASLQERNAAAGKSGRQRDVEATVAIEINGILAVAFQAFLIGEEHRNTGAVLAGVEHLFGGVAVQVEIHLRSCEKRALVLLKIILIDGSGNGKGSKGIEALRLSPLTTEADTSHRRQFHLTDPLTVETVDKRMI